MLLHEALYVRGCRLVAPYLELPGWRPAPIHWWSRWRLWWGLKTLERSLQLAPDAWVVMWLIAKTHQALRDDARADAWFLRACEGLPESSVLYHEAAVACGWRGRWDLARFYLARARSEGNTSALIALVTGHPAEARAFAAEAAETDPYDPLHRRLLALIHAVVDGAVPGPPGSHATEGADEASWTVVRQDDRGNRFVVATGLSKQSAEQVAAEFEARGHKQSYWAIEGTLTSNR